MISMRIPGSDENLFEIDMSQKDIRNVTFADGAILTAVGRTAIDVLWQGMFAQFPIFKEVAEKGKVTNVSEEDLKEAIKNAFLGVPGAIEVLRRLENPTPETQAIVDLLICPPDTTIPPKPEVKNRSIAWLRVFHEVSTKLPREFTTSDVIRLHDELSNENSKACRTAINRFVERGIVERVSSEKPHTFRLKKGSRR